MQITILGKRWRVEYRSVRDDALLRKNWGYCTDPAMPRRRIVLRKQLQHARYKRLRMEVLLHEALHAAGWNLDEAWVERFAEDVVRLLTNEGLC